MGSRIHAAVGDLCMRVVACLPAVGDLVCEHVHELDIRADRHVVLVCQVCVCVCVCVYTNEVTD